MPSKIHPLAREVLRQVQAHYGPSPHFVKTAIDAWIAAGRPEIEEGGDEWERATCVQCGGALAQRDEARALAARLQTELDTERTRRTDDNFRLTAERDQARADAERFGNTLVTQAEYNARHVSELRANLARLRPVVEAACVLRESWTESVSEDDDPPLCALLDAVDTYRAQPEEQDESAAVVVPPKGVVRARCKVVRVEPDAEQPAPDADAGEVDWKLVRVAIEAALREYHAQTRGRR